MKIALSALILFLTVISVCFAEKECYIDTQIIDELKMARFELTEHSNDLVVVGRSIQETKRALAFIDLNETLDVIDTMLSALTQMLTIENIHAKDKQCNSEAIDLVKNYVSSTIKEGNAASTRINVLLSQSEDNLINSEYKESTSLLDKINKILYKINKELPAEQK